MATKKIQILIVKVKGNMAYLETTSMEGMMVLRRLQAQLPEHYEFRGTSFVQLNYSQGELENHINVYCNPDVIEVINLVNDEG